jgi:hypothetical protein
VSITLPRQNGHVAGRTIGSFGRDSGIAASPHLTLVARRDSTAPTDVIHDAIIPRRAVLTSARNAVSLRMPWRSQAAARRQQETMTTLTLSATRGRSDREQPCAACGALFVPVEDSGSRVLSISAPEQEPFSALMCGGCFSKWSHGKAMTIRSTATG